MTRELSAACRPVLTAAALVLLGPGTGPGAEPPLPGLKAATVYVRVKAGGPPASGSGFVIRADGDTAYVVTNHHVVNTSPGQRPGALPPFFHAQVRPKPLQPPGVEVTVVFRSGTPAEQAVKATVVGADEKADLAILKATGVKDVPKPLDATRSPKVVETMTVLTLGFPFGPALGPDKGNPAVTVTKAAVSSLRHAADGALDDVQVVGDLYPGNSGGPVVDEAGALVGVTVAGVRNTRIAFVIPARKLNWLLEEGRVELPDLADIVWAEENAKRIKNPGPFTGPGQAPGPEVRVGLVVRVVDPLGRVRSPVLLYGPADKLTAPARGPNGWPKLAGASTSELKLEGAAVLHVLPIPAPKSGEQKILAQVRYRDPAGKAVFGEPKVVSYGPDADLGRLLRLLDSPDRAVRQEAADELSMRRVTYRVEDVRAGLRPLLRKHTPADRGRVMRLLAEFDPREAAPAVAELLADKDPGVRTAAYSVLGGLRDPRTVDALVAAVPKDSVHALGVLRGIGPAAEKGLLPYLAPKHDKVRFFVITTLQEIGTAPSLAALEALPADDPLALHVRNAVAAIRGRPPKDDPAEMKTGEAAAEVVKLNKPNAARSLLAIGPPAEKAVLSLLTSPRDPNSPAEACWVLGQIGGRDSVAPLRAAADKPDPLLACAAAQALASVEARLRAGKKD